MLSEALKVLKDVLIEVPFRWSQIRVKILDDLCECYWGLDIYDEYLINLLEYLELNLFRIKDNSKLEKRIEKAVKSLKHRIEIPFEPYFTLKSGHIEYTKNGELSLKLQIFSKLNSVNSAFI